MFLFPNGGKESEQHLEGSKVPMGVQVFSRFNVRLRIKKKARKIVSESQYFLVII